MIEIKYICDKCEATQPTAQQMWMIRVQIGHHGGGYNQMPWSSKEEMWCRKCIEGLGLLPSFDQPAPESVPPPPPSFEDMVREIARDEITQSGGIG
jgi:ribosomal protein L40E